MNRFNIYSRLKKLKYMGNVIIRKRKYSLDKRINKDIIKESNINKIKCCPYCNEKNFIKYGKSNGVQRFKCRNNSCGKTFSEQIYSPFRYSKKFKYMWKEYYDLMQQGLTIRQCAGQLRISIITAFYWRHRILNSFLNSNVVREFKGQVEISNISYVESFKGTRLYKEYSENSNIKRDKINIVSIIDTERNIDSIVVSRNNIKIDDLINRIYNKIHKDALLIAYQDSRLKGFAKKHNANIGKNYSVRVRRIKNLFNKNTIKKSTVEKIRLAKPLEPTFGVRLKKWISKFRGVATKYIDHYLRWYVKIYIVEKLNRICISDVVENYLRWVDIKGRSKVV